MRSRLIQIMSFLFLLACSAFGQTTTITGVIDDLTVNPVTSGKGVFTLKPSVDTTISGNARFTPGQPVTCYIQSNGTLLNAAQTGSCTVVTNTSLTPAGTSYRVDICPYFSCSSSFNFYAINTTSRPSSRHRRPDRRRTLQTCSRIRRLAGIRRLRERPRFRIWACRP
jgi:hypothetical protein